MADPLTPHGPDAEPVRVDKQRMLLAWELRCPSCGGDHVKVIQVGYFVNSLVLLCYDELNFRDEPRAHSFVGPTVVVPLPGRIV